MSALFVSRVAGALLVVSAGVAAIVAATRRWASCPFPDFDTAACSTVQDHLYDAQFPSDPWVPIGNAAQWEGVGYLLLAAGLCVVGGGTRRVWWRTLMQLALGALLGVIGVATLASGVQRVPVAPSLDLQALGVWSWAGPALLIAGLGMSRAAVGLGPRRFGLWLAGVCLLTLTTPLGEFLIIPTFAPYRSYDSLPWSGALRGILLIAAGALFLTAILLPRRPEPDRAVPALEGHAAAGAIGGDGLRPGLSAPGGGHPG